MPTEGALVQVDDEPAGYQDSLRAAARFVLWTLAWVLTLALARFGPEHVWDAQPVVSWAAVGANLVVGVGWIVAFARLLQAMDELDRKILQDALVVTLGVGWIVGFAYVVADAAGLIAYDVSIAVFPALLGVVYLVAFAAGKLRYR
jgi:hypothetical protein